MRVRRKSLSWLENKFVESTQISKLDIIRVVIIGKGEEQIAFKPAGIRLTS
jgi:hypothetical protein